MSEIIKAIIRAQHAASSVEKTSRNDFHKYAYASAESIILEARQALHGAGLALITRAWEVKEERIHVAYELLHESGEMASFTLSSPVIIEKGRPADKAEAAALTYNLGYFLRGLLLLPRVAESDDVDQRDDRNHDPCLALKLELSTLFQELGDPPMNDRVLKQIAKKGDGAVAYAAAIRYVRGLIAGKLNGEAPTDTTQP